MLHCKRLKDSSDEEDEVYTHTHAYILHQNEIVL